jgi:hypothetical protein
MGVGLRQGHCRITSRWEASLIVILLVRVGTRRCVGIVGSARSSAQSLRMRLQSSLRPQALQSDPDVEDTTSRPVAILDMELFGCARCTEACCDIADIATKVCWSVLFPPGRWGWGA